MFPNPVSAVTEKFMSPSPSFPPRSKIELVVDLVLPYYKWSRWVKWVLQSRVTCVCCWFPRKGEPKQARLRLQFKWSNRCTLVHTQRESRPRSKFEIEFGTMTRRASAEGTSIRGVYAGAVQSPSCFLRTVTAEGHHNMSFPGCLEWELLNKDVHFCFSTFFQLLIVNKVNRLEDFVKVDHANALARAATQASDKMANASICRDYSKVFSHLRVRGWSVCWSPSYE